MNIFKNKKVLVCGGTGSIGSEIVRQLLKKKAAQIRILARDEMKHQALATELKFPKNVRSLVGDVRDLKRLQMAMDDIDIVFHTAALKAIQYCEYNPFEAVMTNVYGTQNVIQAALQHNVEKLITISTDKAAGPSSTLGATKLLAERITAAADYYRGRKKTKFAAVRFGNVLGSRGSVLPIIADQIRKGQPVTITKNHMTRFIMSIPQAVNLVFEAAEIMQGGEIFILKMPVVNISELINIFIRKYCQKHQINVKHIKIEYVGMRPGERTDEKLLTEDEAEYAYENNNLFMLPSTISKPNERYTQKKYPKFRKLKTKQGYTSNQVKVLSQSEIDKLITKTHLI